MKTRNLGASRRLTQGHLFGVIPCLAMLILGVITVFLCLAAMELAPLLLGLYAALAVFVVVEQVRGIHRRWRKDGKIPLVSDPDFLALKGVLCLAALAVIALGWRYAEVETGYRFSEILLSKKGGPWLGVLAAVWASTFIFVHIHVFGLIGMKWEKVERPAWWEKIHEPIKIEGPKEA